MFTTESPYDYSPQEINLLSYDEQVSNVDSQGFYQAMLVLHSDANSLLDYNSVGDLGSAVVPSFGKFLDRLDHILYISNQLSSGQIIEWKDNTGQSASNGDVIYLFNNYWIAVGAFSNFFDRDLLVKPESFLIQKISKTDKYYEMIPQKPLPDFSGDFYNDYGVLDSTTLKLYHPKDWSSFAFLHDFTPNSGISTRLIYDRLPAESEAYRKATDSFMFYTIDSDSDRVKLIDAIIGDFAYNNSTGLAWLLVDDDFSNPDSWLLQNSDNFSLPVAKFLLSGADYGLAEIRQEARDFFDSHLNPFLCAQENLDWLGQKVGLNFNEQSVSFSSIEKRKLIANALGWETSGLFSEVTINYSVKLDSTLLAKSSLMKVWNIGDSLRINNSLEKYEITGFSSNSLILSPSRVLQSGDRLSAQLSRKVLNAKGLALEYLSDSWINTVDNPELFGESMVPYNGTSFYSGNRSPVKWRILSISTASVATTRVVEYGSLDGTIISGENSFRLLVKISSLPLPAIPAGFSLNSITLASLPSAYKSYKDLPLVWAAYNVVNLFPSTNRVLDWAGKKVFYEQVSSTDGDLPSYYDSSEFKGIYASRASANNIKYFLETFEIKGGLDSDYTTNTVKDFLKSSNASRVGLEPMWLKRKRVRPPESTNKVDFFSNDYFSENNSVLFRLPFCYSRDGETWNRAQWISDNQIEADTTSHVQYEYLAANSFTAGDYFFEKS